MAFRAASNWRSMLNQMGRARRSFASSTMDAAQATARASVIRAEFAPVYIVMGMVTVAVIIASHTAKQQLMHSPAVYLNKKKRESVPEVEDPDRVIRSADKFINKSFLRKVAHIQDNNRTLPDTSRPNPFTKSRNAETLKTVGVEPGRH